MNRGAFHQLFATRGPVVLPVIHVLETAATLRNIEILTAAGAPGCFLINHDFEVARFLPIIRAVRASAPDLWMGVNFLAVTGRDAFPVLGQLAREDCRIDAYWADDARIEERADPQTEAEEIAAVRAASAWTGLYFGGVAFKKQRPVEPRLHRTAAANATGFMDVITTSGPATGMTAEASKISDFRAGVGDRPLALASGVTPDNAATYADVDAFLVATGINRPDDFYNIDAERLTALLQVASALGDRRSP
jgi:predicted TIM-barrel enzyme